YRGAAVEGAYVKDYEVYVSQDGDNWGSPVARGTFEKNSDVQSVLFFSSARARYIRLVAVSSHDGGDFAAVSEIDIIPAE
ncbi:MAG: discoidin domain-containing protein, partial [Akkermansia sp.]|nr:discoidin domain-containing protein [Akkermansia sp.]